MLEAKEPRKCVVCDQFFYPLTKISRFCSEPCRNTFYKSEYRKFNDPSLSHSTRGAVSELSVAADLFRHGWEVFRALAPDASCDLVAMQHGATLRVQVKTATLKDSSTFYSVDLTKEEGRYDIVALVSHCGTVVEYLDASGLKWSPRKQDNTQMAA